MAKRQEESCQEAKGARTAPQSAARGRREKAQPEKQAQAAEEVQRKPRKAAKKSARRSRDEKRSQRKPPQKSARKTSDQSQGQRESPRRSKVEAGRKPVQDQRQQRHGGADGNQAAARRKHAGHPSAKTSFYITTAIAYPERRAAYRPRL